MLTRDNFGELLTPIHKKIMVNSYTEKPAQYSKLFKVDKMNRKEETIPHLGGFGMWAANTEGNTINESAMHEGETATFIAERYDNSYSLTWELVQDDQHNVFKGKGKDGDAKSLGRGLRVRIETNCAGIINGGFANTGYDGVSLFNDSHPLVEGGTCDNLVTGAISDTTMKAATTLLRAHVDEAGLKIEARADKAFAAANKEWDLYTILKSSGPAGVLSNDKNVIPSLEPVVLDYLTDNYWGVMDSSFENLMFFWREKPLFGGQPKYGTMDWKLYGYARFTAGYSDWRGLVASAG